MKVLALTDSCVLSQNKLQEKVCKLSAAIRPCQHLAAHTKHSDSIQHMELYRRNRHGTVLVLNRLTRGNNLITPEKSNVTKNIFHSRELSGSHKSRS